MNPKTFGLAAAAIGLLCVARARSADENAGALPERIVALAKTVTADDYAFTRTARVEEIQADKTETHVTLEKFDPRKPVEQRWTLLEVDGRAPTADELKAHRKEAPKRRVAHYGRVANYFGSPSTTSTGQAGRIVFRFTQLPKESLVVTNADLSSSAVAEATVDTTAAVPFVERVQFTLTKPTRLMVVAKVEQLEATTRYRMLPDGKPVPVEQVSEMSGSMLGKSGQIKTVLTYTDYTRAR